jgi:dTDP-4-dehydrorhamnose reductase
MKVLVLGGAGMLGHKVVQRLAAGYPDLWWTLRGSLDDPELRPIEFLHGDHVIEHVDAMRVEALESLVRELRPEAIVNCLGVIKQRVEAVSEERCMTINAHLPHRLAKAATGWGGRLIQISTDCVFDGRRGAYTEDDEPNATDLYGRSKALGEVRQDNAITLRTSLIGRELKYHKSLLDWFLAQQNRRIQGYRRVIWSGVTTLYLAELIDKLLIHHPTLSGVYHVASEPRSKFALLEQLRDAYDLDVEIDPVDTVRTDLSLVSSRFEQATGYRCPPWPHLIADLVADPTPYPAISRPMARG